MSFSGPATPSGPVDLTPSGDYSLTRSDPLSPGCPTPPPLESELVTKESDVRPAPAVIGVVLVDAHEVLTSSLALAIAGEPDMKVLGIAADLPQAERLLEETQPDVVVIEHRLRSGEGAADLRALGRLSPETRFVVLASDVADHALVAAVAEGRNSVLSTARPVTELFAAVRSAAAGEAVISPDLLRRLLPRLSVEPRLTAREFEVLDLLTEGLSNAAIAARLDVSTNTVRNHIAKMSTKLGAHSKLELLSVALREGLISPS
jgi:DNA-binding NarL/FixJ family response regulator